MGTPSPNTSDGIQLKRLSGHNTDRFFKVLAETCNITRAAKSIGFSREYMHQVRLKDPEFAQRWEEAVDSATDTLEAEARRRALEGYERPVFFQGKQVGAETLYSDALMVTLLKAHRPEKFRDKGLELPPGSEIVISMRTGTDEDNKPIDVTPQPDKPESITD